MNVEEIREYCLSLKHTAEGMPFGEDTLVFKVGGKIFALLSLRGDNRLNLKCLPELAVELREQFDYVIPGYHMNKKHWNSILCDLATREELIEWINHSYELVVSSLPKKQKP